MDLIGGQHLTLYCILLISLLSVWSSKSALKLVKWRICPLICRDFLFTNRILLKNTDLIMLMQWRVPHARWIVNAFNFLENCFCYRICFSPTLFFFAELKVLRNWIAKGGVKMLCWMMLFTQKRKFIKIYQQFHKLLYKESR